MLRLCGFQDKLFDQILMENARLIHDVAWSHSGVALARDLEQEILLALWESLDRYEGKSSLTTWVYGVALNTTRWFNRANRRPGTIVELKDADVATAASLSENQLKPFGQIRFGPSRT
ncbi:MAG: sigma factor [Acidobacteriota bacterium]